MMKFATHTHVLPLCRPVWHELHAHALARVEVRLLGVLGGHRGHQLLHRVDVPADQMALSAPIERLGWGDVGAPPSSSAVQCAMQHVRLGGGGNNPTPPQVHSAARLQRADAPGSS